MTSEMSPLQELFVSVVSAAIVFPVTVFVTLVFRSSQRNVRGDDLGSPAPRTSKPESSRNAHPEEAPSPPAPKKHVTWREEDLKEEERENDDVSILMGELDTAAPEADPDPESPPASPDPEAKARAREEAKPPSKAMQTLGKVLLITAWVLAGLAVFVSAFFVILYSMEWGAEVSNAWLLAFLLSFVVNCLIADPAKVSLLSLHTNKRNLKMGRFSGVAFDEGIVLAACTTYHSSSAF